MNQQQTLQSSQSTGLDLGRLRTGFSGQILTAEDGEAYDIARMAFNGMFDRRPAVIARATCTADVVHALDFARAGGLAVAVRGGGHSVAGYSTIEGGLLLDLGAMKAIDVDPQARLARVQPGVVWGELDRATQAHGLATTGGRMTTTGVAGFTLGSGSGWLERLYGSACDNLLGRGSGHRRRRRGHRERVRASGPAVGPARRRWQLRDRHGVHVSAASRRPGGVRRAC